MQLRFVLLLIIAMRVQGCACAGNWPSVKQAWREAPFVFLGTVEIADPDRDSRETIFQEQFVRIRVDELFKGVFTGQTIELHEGGNDCAAKFRTGQRAVFYLYPGTTPGSWFVPPCTHSLGSAAPSGDDLLFLRKLPKSAIGTRFSGEVELYEDSAKEAFRRVGGVPKASVKISGPKGSTIVTTNVDGTYEVYNLPPGNYSVSIKTPKGYRIAFPVSAGSPSPQSRTLKVSRDETAVELTENGGVSVDFVLKADTRVSGRILDANNLPIKDVCIDLEPLEGRGESGVRFFDCSKSDGAFEMEMMPPGKYWLVARDEMKVNQLKSKSTLYYPGVRDREDAKIVSVELGQPVEHLDITLPSDEKRYQFTGRMEFADGGPVAYATVNFTSSRHGYSEATETGRDGSFSLSVVAGMEGQLDGDYLSLTGCYSHVRSLRLAPRFADYFTSSMRPRFRLQVFRTEVI